MPTESISKLMARLNEQGYTDLCRTEEDGIHFVYGHVVFQPEDLHVDEVFRLEGTSAPDEQTAIFALATADGEHRGTFCVAHGVGVDALDADAMQRLNMRAEAALEPMGDTSLHVQY